MTATQATAKNQDESTRAEEVDASVALEAAYALGRSSWPEVVLSYESFHAHATRLGSSRWVVPAHPGDLYLCAACQNGEAAAYEALEAKYFPAVKQVVNRIVGERLVLEEVLQEIRTRLFVGRAPKISSYRGSGPLAGWLRSLAVNMAQDRLRANIIQRGRMRKLASAQRDASTRTTLDECGDERVFRGKSAQVCGHAWWGAIGSLCTDERQLLQQYFVSGVSVDTLGSLFGVHRATIHRRIRRATEHLRRQVRESLTSHYWDLTEGDRDALAFSAGCELDLSEALVRGDVGSSPAAPS
ncbi:MAG: sigma-70 family RNA polymerase sigma factor [Deltaproteobacteria bacterium]